MQLKILFVLTTILFTFSCMVSKSGKNSCILKYKCSCEDFISEVSQLNPLLEDTNHLNDKIAQKTLLTFNTIYYYRGILDTCYNKNSTPVIEHFITLYQKVQRKFLSKYKIEVGPYMSTYYKKFDIYCPPQMGGKSMVSIN